MKSKIKLNLEEQSEILAERFGEAVKDGFGALILLWAIIPILPTQLPFPLPRGKQMDLECYISLAKPDLEKVICPRQLVII